jgi:hypothetical protein
MNLFKAFTLKWWQTGAFKLGMLSLGLSAGVYFHAALAGYLIPLLAVAAVSLGYVTVVWWKQ